MNQFFLRRKASDGFMGSYRVVKVYEPFQFILPVSRRGEKGFLMPKFHDRFDDPFRFAVGFGVPDLTFLSFDVMPAGSRQTGHWFSSVR